MGCILKDFKLYSVYTKHYNGDTLQELLNDSQLHKRNLVVGENSKYHCTVTEIINQEISKYIDLYDMIYEFNCKKR